MIQTIIGPPNSPSTAGLRALPSEAAAKSLAGGSQQGISANAPIEPVAPVRRRSSEQPPNEAPIRFADERRISGIDAEQARRAKLREQAAGHSETASDRSGALAATSLADGGFTKATFLVQVLGQEGRLTNGERGVRFRSELSEQRNALERGSEIYRQAGAEPELYSDAPAVFRVAV